jgi:hypothetical protein
MKKCTIDEYLEKAARFANSDYGKLIRNQFQDSRGDTELAMIVAPTKEELEELKRAVAIMTPAEKENASSLTDEQVQKLAADASVDPANLA